MDFSKEADFQDFIAKDKSLQKDICKLLDIDFERTKFEKEVEFINGIYSDFSLFESGKIRAIVECKGGKINVTDYVRGIGQIFQYEYFAEKHLSNRSYDFCDIKDFSSVYIFPDAVIKNNTFNVGLFKYPQSKKILEVNSKSLAVRLIDENELKKLGECQHNDIHIISQYYIRDNRLFELHFLLNFLSLCKIKKIKIHRESLCAQDGLLRKTNTINNGNWKNAFISLSSLGFIDNNNYPTQVGTFFANLEFCEFAYKMFDSYLKPYFECIFEILPKNINETNAHLSNEIKRLYKGKEVLFLTQSNGRYISSWLNIARDDFAFIDFEPRTHKRKIKILLNPLKTNERAFKEHIEKFSKYNDFKEIFERILREI